MSKYIAKHKDGRSIAYGFDSCGIPGLFINDDEGDWDTRGFMAEPSSCVLKGKGGFIDRMLTHKANGFVHKDMDKHIRTAAMDLEF